MEEIYNMWDWLVDTGIATDEEVRLVTNINGLSMEVLNDILYARTGYISREQMEEQKGKGRNIMKTLSQVKKDVCKEKIKLINKAKNKGGVWENFGDKEVRKLKDKYASHQYTNDEVFNEIYDFEKWTMYFTL